MAPVYVFPFISLPYALCLLPPRRLRFFRPFPLLCLLRSCLCHVGSASITSTVIASPPQAPLLRLPPPPGANGIFFSLPPPPLSLHAFPPTSPPRTSHFPSLSATLAGGTLLSHLPPQVVCHGLLKRICLSFLGCRILALQRFPRSLRV